MEQSIDLFGTIMVEVYAGDVLTRNLEALEVVFLIKLFCVLGGGFIIGLVTWSSVVDFFGLKIKIFENIWYRILI